VVINSFSGHADQLELLDFVSGCLPLKKVFLVHGEPEQSQALSGFYPRRGWIVAILQRMKKCLLN
jgi:predicted metal-dependent RNase